METTIVVKIKCPCCGAILAVKKTEGIEKKTVKCPVCGESTPYEDFKPVAGQGLSENTVYPDGNSAAGCCGLLRVIGSDKPVFRLKEGHNVVGRKADSSKADFQITVDGSKCLSREHLRIEVKRVPGKGIVHYASLCKMKCNATYINGERLEYGDCIVLQSGDRLELPDVSIKFEIPDEDGTEL